MDMEAFHGLLTTDTSIGELTKSWVSLRHASSPPNNGVSSPNRRRMDDRSTTEKGRAYRPSVSSQSLEAAFQEKKQLLLRDQWIETYSEDILIPVCGPPSDDPHQASAKASGGKGQ